MILLQACSVAEKEAGIFDENPSVFMLAASFLAIYAAGVMLFYYLRGVSQFNKKGKRWNRWRTVSFNIGIVLLMVSMSPPVMEYSHDDFRGHMVQHLVLAMLAPIGLVLGAPLTLAMQTLRARGKKTISSALNSPLVHFFSHPFSALALNIGSMYLLYLTPLYNELTSTPHLPVLIHLHFLLTGYLFTWVIIGPDAAPRRPKLATRTIVLFVSIAAHACLCKMMYAYGYPRNSSHSLQEIREAAQMMYYGGDFSELVLATALFATWYSKKGKPYYRFSF